MTTFFTVTGAVILVGFLIFFRKPLKTLASIADRKLKPLERSALSRDIALTHQFIEELVEAEGEHPLTPEEMLDALFSGKGKLRIKRSFNDKEE